MRISAFLCVLCVSAFTRADETAVNARIATIWKWHETTPGKPWIIKGKIVSILSGTELLIQCDKDDIGLPTAEGTIYLSAYPKAATLIDGDPVHIGATLTGRYEHTTALGKRTLRAYRYLPKILSTIPK